VKVVGYNNGVIHFGQRFSGKTVVSTVGCQRIVRVAPDILRADCGATIRDATRFLSAAGQELYVLPNYSYVCLGTAFFVPIHGSAVQYSTVADTIVRALLYDPACDRFIVATRNQSVFREQIYNQMSSVLILRLWMLVKPKARYFVRHDERTEPTGEDLLNALRDPKASNVEIRKSKAANSSVRISAYFAAQEGSRHVTGRKDNTLEFARDSLGRLWDRLEENSISSFLLHASTRYFAWHIELFFSMEEFIVFWKSHKALPIRKIQLRYIRRDGLPHSAFRDHDCVSVDLFMFRWKRSEVETYLRNTFAVVRTNPGKHSQ
jgi:FAD/FMN-containing dehydrogenase